MLIKEKYRKKTLALDEISPSELDKYNIVGYLFYTNKSNIQKLNLYIVDTAPYEYSDCMIKSNNVIEAFNEFRRSPNKSIYSNPPIDMWLDKKTNWCKSLARRLSMKYGLDYDDILSECYYTINKLYNKNKFMDNLSYVEKSVNNSILLAIRKNKSKFNEDNVVSLFTPVSSSDEEITYEDILVNNNVLLPEKEMLNKEQRELIDKYFARNFTPREIETIQKCTATSYIPRNIYLRLLKMKNNIVFRNEIKNMSDYGENR